MKNFALKTIALTLLIFTASAAFSQDKIYKKNDEVILCKVIEIGEDVIKYTLEETDDLAYVLDKAKIEKIVLGNGKELVFQSKMTDPSLYIGQSKNAFKIGMFSPLTGALNLGYERSIKPGMSVEGSLGLIGLGTDVNNRNSGGGYIKAGIKFISTPSFELRGMKYSHLLKGFYFRPEIVVSVYETDVEKYSYNPVTFYSTYSKERKGVVAGALVLNFGKQWVMNDVFLVDLFAGFGYGLDNFNSSSNYEYYGPKAHYGFILGEDIPLAGTLGLKVGFLTK
jgi:hypothetical protein